MADYTALDIANSQQTHLDSANIHLLRIPLVGKDILHYFLVVQTDASGKIKRGNYINIIGTETVNQTLSNSGTAATFNGQISYHSLKSIDMDTYRIANGYIQRGVATVNQPFGTKSNDQNTIFLEEKVQVLPEVIVSTTYLGNGGISWGDWYNLIAMLDAGGGSSGSSNNYYVGGGGSDSNGTSPAVKIDFENPENKAAIDPKKYIDCFGIVADAGATCTITISTDIPVDGQPDKFFDWSTGSLGHTYIELYKNGSGGLVQQNVGFYPNSAWKTAGSGNVGSKIVDNAGHEYNARYTISVTPQQLQAALNTILNNSSKDYNISQFNCTDFALAVFNAGGCNLTIPHYSIPGFPNGAASSNTPQGLYNQLNTMGGNGNTNVQMPGIKGYGRTSKGRCN